MMVVVTPIPISIASIGNAQNALDTAHYATNARSHCSADDAAHWPRRTVSSTNALLSSADNALGVSKG